MGSKKLLWPTLIGLFHVVVMVVVYFQELYFVFSYCRAPEKNFKIKAWERRMQTAITLTQTVH